MSNWKEKTLSEYCEFQEGYVNPPKGHSEYFGGDIKWCRAVDINNGYVYSTSQTLTDAGFNSAKKSAVLFKPNTIVITKSGTIGRLGIIKDYMCGNRATINIIPKNNADVEFVFYLLRSRQNEFFDLAVGSVQKNLYVSILEKMMFKFPSLYEQKKIASFFSVIDKKIDINNRINRNLSELLATMYKHDYLEEVPNHEEWIEVTMDDITSKFATGLNPRKNFVLGHGENYYVTIKNMNNNRIYLDSKCDRVDDEALVKINKRSDLKVGDLLFSGIGTIGRVHLIDEPPINWNISESVFTMRPSELVSSEFLYLLLLSYDMQYYVISLASGSVQKGIRMADLKRYKLYLPSKRDMDRMTSNWKPLINQIKKHEKENDELAVLRDSLLPKLMSGELDVSNLKI